MVGRVAPRRKKTQSLCKINLKLLRRFVSTVLHRLAYKTDSFTSIYSAVLKISQEFTIKGLNNFIIEGA